MILIKKSLSVLFIDNSVRKKLTSSIEVVEALLYGKIIEQYPVSHEGDRKSEK